MLSRRSSNVDEMVRAALAEESLLLKEKERWRAPYVVDFAVVRCAPPSVGGISCLYTVIRVVAGDDGVVPGCPGGGVAVEVAADDDGVVPGRSSGGIADGGTFEDPVKRRDIGMSLMESVARRPQWMSWPVYTPRASPMESVAWRPQ